MTDVERRKVSSILEAVTTLIRNKSSSESSERSDAFCVDWTGCACKEETRNKKHPRNNAMRHTTDRIVPTVPSLNPPDGTLAAGFILCLLETLACGRKKQGFSNRINSPGAMHLSVGIRDGGARFRTLRIAKGAPPNQSGVALCLS